MGLLDDAIREHLELKRLRGADPGLVAREEREAIGAVRGGEPVDADGDVAAGAGLAVEDAHSVEGDLGQASQPGQAQAFSNVGQETAELDMRTVLGDESGGDGTQIGDRPLAGGAAEHGAADDSLEWEMPGDGESGGAGEQLDDLHDGESDEDHQGEPVEDVLEETPDFLRDTPEQERLWFEQRPPRDFDFDK